MADLRSGGPESKKKTLTLASDHLISGSVNAEVLPWTIVLLSLVSIAPAVFPLEHGQTVRHTNRQTQLNALSPAGGCTAGVGYLDISNIIISYIKFYPS